MSLEDYWAQVERNLRMHGQHIVWVFAGGPFERDFYYTITPEPDGTELLVASCCGDANAAHAIELVREQARAGRLRLEPGETVESADVPGGRLVLGAVWPQWAANLTTGAFHFHDVPPEERRVVQVIFPDPRGRLPFTTGYQRDEFGCQPHFDRVTPWLTPIVHTRDGDIFLPERLAREHVRIAVPVFDGTALLGRYELVVGRLDGPGEAMLVRAPSHADHVTAGTRLAVRTPVPSDGLLPKGAWVMAEVIAPSPATQLNYALHVYDLDDEAAFRAAALAVVGAVDELVTTRQALTATTTGNAAYLATLHVATLAPDDVRMHLRPMVRDGWLSERSLRSAPRLPEPRIHDLSA